MGALVVAIALLAQVVIPEGPTNGPGYVLDANTPDERLVLADGSYELVLNPQDCGWLEGNQNVVVEFGNGVKDGPYQGYVGVQLSQGEQRCGGLVGSQLDDVPCVMNADGACDLAAAAIEQ